MTCRLAQKRAILGPDGSDALLPHPTITPHIRRGGALNPERYELLGTIGVGGFSRVQLARDRKAPEGKSDLVAIKRLRRHRPGESRLRRDPTRRLETFRYEAEICRYLDHPNLVKILDLVEAGSTCYLVMEFINGLGLDELLHQRRSRNLAIPPDIALDIAIQAARGLQYAHNVKGADGRSLNIVHRDIKPSNIMIGRDGRVRVMDFGVARSDLQVGQTTVGTIKGTLRYLSPEQAKGARTIGPASDQFGLALVLAEMLTGRPVYDSDKEHKVLLKATHCQVSPSVRDAERACPGIGPILSRALAANPGDRFESVGAFADALSRVDPQMHSLIGLAEWVDEGLEERARRAAAEPGLYAFADTTEHSGSFADISDASDYGMGSRPLGWAHEALTQTCPEDGCSEGDARGLDPTLPLVSRPLLGVEESAGWAMLPDEPLLHLMESLEDPTDPFVLGDERTGEAERGVIIRREEDDAPPPAEMPSPTAYALSGRRMEHIDSPLRGRHDDALTLEYADNPSPGASVEPVGQSDESAELEISPDQVAAWDPGRFRLLEDKDEDSV